MVTRSFVFFNSNSFNLFLIFKVPLSLRASTLCPQWPIDVTIANGHESDKALYIDSGLKAKLKKNGLKALGDRDYNNCKGIVTPNQQEYESENDFDFSL